MILDDPRITVTERSDDVSISYGSRQAIFTDVLSMKCAAAKFVPKLLNFEHKPHIIDIAQEMLTTFKGDLDLLKKVTTDEESWVYDYDIETKTDSNGSVQKSQD